MFINLILLICGILKHNKLQIEATKVLGDFVSCHSGKFGMQSNIFKILF